MPTFQQRKFIRISTTHTSEKCIDHITPERRKQATASNQQMYTFNAIGKSVHIPEAGRLGPNQKKTFFRFELCYFLPRWHFLSLALPTVFILTPYAVQAPCIFT